VSTPDADADTETDAESDGDAESASDTDSGAGAGSGSGSAVDSALDTDARRLLYDLVDTPSPSGSEEACARRLAAFFEARGREVFVDEVGNVRAPADDSLLLTSHVDTVPGDIPVRVEESELWGRGSVDAKGPLAAMAVAAVETGVSFVGVVGEETDSRGARHLLENRAAPDALINGEPSGWNAVTLGYRGFLSGTYLHTSESGHTSRPDPNAIEDAIAWWRRVQAEFEPDEWTPVFEQVTAKPVDFQGGLGDDGLSVEATVDAQFRIPPELSAGEVRERADAALDGGTVNWKEPIPPVMESPRNPVARAFRAAIRGADGDVTLLRKTGTSDMNLFRAVWDCPMATYGPGDSNLDHAPDEHIALADFDRAVRVLTEVSERV
jgi:LysW-gamma-L-lysine carboxypeptidase